MVLALIVAAGSRQLPVDAVETGEHRRQIAASCRLRIVGESEDQLTGGLQQAQLHIVGAVTVLDPDRVFQLGPAQTQAAHRCPVDISVDNVELTSADRKTYTGQANTERAKGFQHVEVSFDQAGVAPAQPTADRESRGPECANDP